MDNFFFDDHGRFVINDYTDLNPFASFLPGIAGPMGIPMWVFYVNRGQAVASFGVESKDAAITEFLPANKAYQSVSYTGFRTFLRADGWYYEPFAPYSSYRRRTMAVGMNELELEETNTGLGLKVNVAYFTLTGQPFAGLVRQVTITNTGEEPAQLEVLDGLPVIIPFGVPNGLLKELGRTAEAWMEVFNRKQGIPFYRVRASIVDRVEIESYEAGHFYSCFTENGRLSPIVDPVVVFGRNTSLSLPDEFLHQPLDALYRANQVTVGRTPCGFFGAEETLSPGGSLTLYGIIGHAHSLDVVNGEVARLSGAAFIAEQRRAANVLAQDLTAAAAIKTAEPLLDAYARQSLLDNVLRGGWPVLLGDSADPIVQHIYSRKHGDLERDYNAFYVAPEYYSQGNGNYRDVNQNRREDVWFEPRVRDYNIISFMNLLQADGYNPLIIQGNRFSIDPLFQGEALSLVENPDGLRTFLAEPFTPGSLLKYVVAAGIRLKVSPEEFLNRTLDIADVEFESTFGEGYWVDHWTYNLDLIENFLSIYPDGESDLFFGRPSYTFYDSHVCVRPRREKYVLKGGRVRQIGALREDEAKAALIASPRSNPHALRIAHGQGEVYYATLFEKLLCLALVKFATLDPMGMGIEMEAGKPGWYDAMNGLPGLFGSSLPETYELVRLLALLRKIITGPELILPPKELVEVIELTTLPVEVFDLLQAVLAALDAYDASNDPDRDFVYWDAVSTARETYRDRVRLGFFDGDMRVIMLQYLGSILARFEAKARQGIARAVAMNGGIPPTYFMYHVEDYEVLDGDSASSDARPVRVTRFRAEALPLFLEGPVKALKLAVDPAEARQLHERVRGSDLFDGKLQMYRINASLDALPLDVGRCRAFPPGWLENGSIWLHMEYKYLLAMLDAGLVEEFYADFRKVLVPFLDPAIYGRSPLENSSFIVSSVHPDPLLHGRGFVARLTGSTVEFLSILHRMMIGRQPFVMRDGALRLVFDPALPGWLFDEDGEVRFTFLGSTTVIYSNPGRKDTFGDNAVRPARITLEAREGEITEIQGGVIGSPYAGMIREGKFKTIWVMLG